MDWSEFKKPINVVFLFVGIAGAIASTFAYFWSLHSAVVSYHVATIQIVDQKEAVPFSVIDNAGQHVSENVYAANVTVWNSGDLPIDPQNIRSPLTISLVAPVRVLDAKLAYTTSDNISKFKIEEIQSDLSKVQIGWKYFDPGEGFRLRLIYASKEEKMIMMSGVIFGVKGFDNLTPPPSGQISFRRQGIIQSSLSVIALIVFYFAFYRYQRWRARDPAAHQVNNRRKRLLALLLVSPVPLLLQLWALYLLTNPPGPPL
jgi:hypothetical protein